MLPLQEGIVYGPIRSRRLGLSLGVNVMPRGRKVCSFNCSYCQYGWTTALVADGTTFDGIWPDPPAVGKAVARALSHLRSRGDRIQRITFSGNGEPTLHPEFAAVVAAVQAVRDEAAPGVPLAILSNSATLERPGVMEALNALDERYMKLDAGDQGLLRRVNAAQVQLDEILDALSRLSDVAIQSMFVKDRLGRIDNSSDLAVSAWIAAVQRVAPRVVHIYSIDRPAAWPYLQAVPPNRLEEIGNRARAAGLNAVTFGTPARIQRAANG
jgi:wyosine [tRNA(Phe)-imidazoG37] synthetase (radical SAM superfamily)